MQPMVLALVNQADLPFALIELSPFCGGDRHYINEHHWVGSFVVVDRWAMKS